MASSPNFYTRRKHLYRQLEVMRDSRVLAYVTGDRQGMETQIHTEVLDFFVDHLDALFPTKRITFILYTRGGDAMAAWSIANLLRMYCEELEVVVPVKAYSAGTLICLGADRIVMTKQSMLGPIDPSLQGPLTPQIPGAPPHARASVSVEAIMGYLDFLKSDVGISREDNLKDLMLSLSEQIHPLVLGQIFRTRRQIQSLARELLRFQVTDPEKQDRIIRFLSSASGSHDYTINRREAMHLGLKIEKPDDDFYAVLKKFYDSVRHELDLNNEFSPETLLGAAERVDFSCPRCLIESLRGGAHAFYSEGEIQRVALSLPEAGGQETYRITQTFEGWRRR